MSNLRLIYAVVIFYSLLAVLYVATGSETIVLNAENELVHAEAKLGRQAMREHAANNVAIDDYVHRVTPLPDDYNTVGIIRNVPEMSYTGTFRYSFSRKAGKYIVEKDESNNIPRH